MSTLESRMAELSGKGTAFVRATVVRAQEPTSAVAGDRAIILADGSMEGFVGGQCAAGSVRSAALDVLGSGESMLLRVLPGSEADADAFPPAPGASVVVNPCLSGGALEIYLEPLLPSPVLHLVGDSPVAQALTELAEPLGITVRSGGAGADPAGATATLVCTHGGDEAGAVRASLDAGVGFVGVVCSRTRGLALLESLDLSVAEQERVHLHVGLDIGAHTAPEIALSILAAIVRAVRVDGLTAGSRDARATEAAAPREVVDPVCGMTVRVLPGTPHARIDGADYWFCNPGCRDRYVAEHAS